MSNAQIAKKSEFSSWHDAIPEDQWDVYRGAIRLLKKEGIPFAAGGAFAGATYTDVWRNTKDLDLYILPKDRERAGKLLLQAGFEDYYTQESYDQRWIYRAHREGKIVDLIWSFANFRAEVDERWLTRGPALQIRGEVLRIIPPEEMIWAKLFVLQKSRCDWPDVLNIIYAVGPSMDWNHLLSRMGEDRPLLAGVMHLFTWMCPGAAAQLPVGVWDELNMRRPPKKSQPEVDEARVRLLEWLPWFAPLIQSGKE